MALQPLALLTDSATVLDWTAATAMRAGELRRDPTSGKTYRRKADGTSRPTFDATEVALFDAVSATADVTGLSPRTLLTAATPLTTPTTPTVNKHTRYSTTAGALTVTLPSTGIVDGDTISVERVDSTTRNLLNVTGSIRGTTATVALEESAQVEVFLRNGSTWWPVGNRVTLASLDSRNDGRYGGLVGTARSAEVRARKTLTLADIGTTWVLGGHRGGCGPMPENTILAAQETYRIAQTMGFQCWLDFDCSLSRDGEPVCVHDLTMARTTAIDSSVANLNVSELKALPADTARGTIPKGYGYAPGWGGEAVRICTVAEVFREFGNKALLSVEAKDDASVVPLCDLIKEFGLVGSVFVNTNNWTRAAAVRSQGIKVHVYGATTDADLPQLNSFKPDAITVGINASAAYIAAVKTYGIFIMGTGESRAMRAKAQANGFRGIVSNEPWYVMGDKKDRSSIATPLKAKVYGRGWITWGTKDDDYAINASATPTPGIQLAAGVSRSVILGDLSGTDRLDSYTLTAELRFTSQPTDNTQWAGIAFGAVDDRDWEIEGVGAPTPTITTSRYVARLHYDGSIDLVYENATNQTTTVLGSAVGTALNYAATDAGTGLASTYTITVTVTPTTVTARRGTAGTLITATHSLSRGGYYALGKNGGTNAGGVKFTAYGWTA